MMQIKKRNGAMVEFEPGKITHALRRAFESCDIAMTEDGLTRMTDEVLAILNEKFPEDGPLTPSVENVQDLVEVSLMQAGHTAVAKHYIVYRYEHAKVREAKQEEVIEKIENKGLTILTRSGRKEVYDEKKIRQNIEKYSKDFGDVIDVDTILSQLKYEIYENITTDDIRRAMTMVARSMIERDPAYSKLAARMLLHTIYEEVIGTDTVDMTKLNELHAQAFKTSIAHGIAINRIDPRLAEFDLDALATSMNLEDDHQFEYLGLQTLYDRYFVRDDKTKKVIETPQMFWMRIAMGTALNEPKETREQWVRDFYRIMAEFYYTPSTPTLFHAGTPKPQLSSCYLNTVPDSLEAIFKSYSDNAQLSKWSGGIGTDWTPLRATGAFIKGTGVESQGVIPFLKIANDVTVAINRSGRRRGAACVYLETWHMDIEAFLELRKNTGDERLRTHDLNTANWIPDLFMKRVRDGKDWTLFSPDEVPDLHDLYGAAFEAAYEAYEAKADRGEITLFKRMPASDLWKKMLAMLFETGHPWITWKDPSNVRSPQDHVGVVHNSNLCTEITLNTNEEETAVCNLGSLNFAKFVRTDGEGKPYFDKDLVGTVTTIAMRMLDNVIDINFYPTEDSKRSNLRHRPVGLGLRGYHDALYMLGIDFDSRESVDFADESMEAVAYHTILASSKLAKERGTYETYEGSKWSRNIFPQDTVALLAKERGEAINMPEGGKMDWAPVRAHVAAHGMRNSNTMAIAPTATTANIVGCIPTVEPIYKNLYVKSNQAGDFVVINKYLVEELKSLNLWNAGMLNKIKYYDGSVQDIQEIPAETRARYKEVFEIDARWLVEAAARRGRWIDQSQSLNIFYAGTSGRELSEIYFLAWQRGLKTTYYLRSLGASQVEKSTVSTAEFGSTHKRETISVTAAGSMGAIETVVDTVIETAVEQPFAQAPAIDAMSEQELAAKLARVASGEEVGICESCEG